MKSDTAPPSAENLGNFVFVKILERTLVVATSAAAGESDHQFWAWLQKT